MTSKITKGLTAALIGAIFLGLAPTGAGAATLGAGALDPTFGTGGLSEEVDPIYKTDYMGGDVVVQPDGRIVAAGSTYGSGPYVLLRYESDGTIDRTFGNNGEARTLGQYNSYRPPVIATQLDGGVSKTLIHWEGDILRYDENGELDMTFGNEGHAWTPHTYPAWARDVETTTAGDRIVTLADPGKFGVSVAGGWQATPQAVFAFTRDGRPDESFGTGGMVLLGEPYLGDTVALKDLEIQPDGKIVVTGGWLTARLLPNGELDESFGEKGIAIEPNTDSRFHQDVEVDDQGRLVQLRCLHSTSSVWGENSWGCQMTRTLSNGAADPSYEGAALSQDDLVENFEVDSKGRSVLFGMTGDWANFTMTRLTPDGAIDPSFGEGGQVVTPTYWYGGIGTGALQADDKPVRVGSVMDYVDYELDMHLWRYLAEPQTATDTDPEPTAATLRGSVIDAKSGRAITGATVDCEGHTTTTDLSGVYAIDLAPGGYSCTASAAGYRAVKARVDVTAEGAIQDFRLR